MGFRDAGCFTAGCLAMLAGFLTLGCASAQHEAARAHGAKRLGCPISAVRASPIQDDRGGNWVAVCEFEYVSLNCDDQGCVPVRRDLPEHRAAELLRHREESSPPHQ